MGLQWTAVATFLYAEIGVLFILCLPFISARRWSSVFQLGIWSKMARFWNKVFLTMIIILIVLLLDAVREMRKYSGAEQSAKESKLQPHMVDHLHMKLFRAQRNFYISGFSLFLWLVMRRVITLINRLASAQDATAALQNQADSANQAAKKYMEDNQLLKQALGEGKKDGGTREGNDLLRNKMDDLKSELKNSEEALKKSQSELEAMKKQNEGLTREYDRLLLEHQELQNAQDGRGDKKDD